MASPVPLTKGQAVAVWRARTAGPALMQLLADLKALSDVVDEELKAREEAASSPT